MKQSIKAVVSDLDGTLLNCEHTLSEFSKKTIKALTSMDVKFLIATGRHHSDAKIIREKLGVEAYIIAANGATVVDPKGDIIHQTELDAGIVEKILTIDVPQGVYKNIYQGDHWMVEEVDKVFDSYYEEGGFKYTLCKFEEQYHRPISKIFFTSLDHTLLTPIESHIRAQYGDFVEVTFSMPQCLEIMAKGINKGKTLETTLSMLGLSIDESVAFGDGMNDFEMLSMVGTGYVMENANEQLKSSLPNNPMVGQNADDAVAKKIIDLFELQSEKDDCKVKNPLSAC